MQVYSQLNKSSVFSNGMVSLSNILFNIMMGILAVIISVWYFVLYLLDIMLDLIEKGTQKLKKIRR